VNRADIKLIARYLVIGYLGYLAWFILQPQFIAEVKGMGDIGIGAIYYFLVC